MFPATFVNRVSMSMIVPCSSILRISTIRNHATVIPELAMALKMMFSRAMTVSFEMCSDLHLPVCSQTLFAAMPLMVLAVVPNYADRGDASHGA